MNRSRSRAAKSGLTLLELLVVLVILATLATVAITSTAGLADQARYEATQRTLTNVREAIVGSPDERDNDGIPLRTGFAADMGRLPKVVPGTGDDASLLTLDELLTPPAGVANYQVWQATPASLPTDQSAEADEEVYLGAGWRGPYVLLPPGETQIRDGWGVPLANPNGGGTSESHLRNVSLPWLPSQPPGSPLTAGAEIVQVWSFGSGDKPDDDETGYQRNLHMSAPIVPSADCTAQVVVTVEIRDGTGNLAALSGSEEFQARLFQPDGATGKLMVQKLGPETPATNPFTFATSPATTAGLRAMRLYDGASNPVSTVRMLKLQPGLNAVTFVVHTTP